MYIRLSDGRVAKRPAVPENVSLPRHPGDEALAALGYARIHPTPRPEGDVVTQGKPENRDGKWYQTWIVRDFTDEERTERAEQVNAERRAGILEERARRLAMGFEYDFGDERGVHYIQTRPADEEGWKQVDRWAAAMTGLGDDTSTLLISTGTGAVQVTAPEWHAIVAHGSTVQQPIWQASFVLRAMDPIPENYADDEWWP